MFTDMKVAEKRLEDDFWKEENPDYLLLKNYHCFSHHEELEFIVFLGNHVFEESHSFKLDGKKKQGFSEGFIEMMREAFKEGYSYLCLYA